jgi:hypothetical protein
VDSNGEDVTTYNTPEEFAAAINDYANKKVQLIAKNVAASAFRDVAQLIVETTPVLTGHARANWLPTVDEPDPGINPGVAGVDLTGEAQTAQEKGLIEETIKEFLGSSSATKLCLTNNLPYIQGLDDGDSRKAPAGIVLPSILAALAAMQDRGVK